VPGRSEDWRPAGLIAASVTPFAADGSLDLPRLAAHVGWLVDAAMDGVAVTAGSGEYVSLTESEREAVVRAAVEAAGGRVPVIAGVLAPSTTEALESARRAAEAGASGLLVLPPYYVRPSLDGVVDHFRRVAAAAPGLPIIAYDNPGRTGVTLGIAELTAIADIPAVAGVKECDRDAASVARKVAALGDRLAILSGDDDTGFATLLSGAVGTIWATPNLAPRLCRALVDACLAGDVATALPLHRRLLPLAAAWDRPNHPGPLKELLAMAGRPVGPARPPLQAMAADERRAARAAFDLAAPVE
jgi:4-hydroxy-tetrahydrodipicolinate synthase